jgi:hypothetical protein
MIKIISNKPSKKSQMQSIDVLNGIRKNKLFQKMNRSELEKFVEYGQRPVYGIPHINYSHKSPKNDEDFERRKIANWKKFSNSILKEKKGHQEVTRIINGYFQQ